MPVNKYFNNFSPAVTSEQLLLEDLVNENVQIMGHDVYYIIRESHDTPDYIIGEIIRSKFERAYIMEMYLKSVEKFDGDDDFFSKFGLEIRDESTFVVPKRAFEKRVPTGVATRPREGDIVYVPVFKRFFEIKHVEEEADFFSLGKRNPYWYELKCEMLRYNQEMLNTGTSEIDDYQADFSHTIQLVLGSGANNYNIGEVVYQGTSYGNATAFGTVTDWDRAAKKLNIMNIIGEFGSGNVIGYSTNTRYSLTTADVLGDFVINDSFENKNIQVEANSIIVQVESNPLGNP
jgi:hypothetical protein